MRKTSLMLLIIVLMYSFNLKQAYCLSSSPEFKQQKIKSIKTKSIEFIENKGQLTDSNGRSTPEILFYAATSGIQFYVRNEGLSFVFSKSVNNSAKTLMKDFTNRNLESEKITEPVLTEYYRTDIDFVGNVLTPLVTGIEPTGAFNNYYLTQCENGILNVGVFAGVKLKNIYPNIDFVVYTNDSNQLEYDFIVNKNGNPDNIKMKVSCFDKLLLTENGNINITNKLGIIEKQKPFSFQMEENINKEIGSSFVISTDGCISFKIESYNPSEPLTIDPLMRVWGTYFGGSSEDLCTDMVIDSLNNLYIVGYTNSEDIIGSGGSQNTKGYDYDAFIAKFDVNGNRIWSTYYGGNGTDFGNAIDLNNNSLYIAGSSSSTSVIGKGGYQSQSARDSVGGYTVDAFFAKFDFNGQRQFGSFYGGNNSDVANDIISDKSGSIYLCGTTRSTNIFGVGGYQSNPGSYFDSYGIRLVDAFLAKFSNNGTVREWGTFFGGNGIDIALGIAIDSIQNAYITGSTESTDVIGAGGYQSSKSTKSDAFIAKFDIIGNKLWSTYYGGIDKDNAENLVVDKNGDIYIVGETKSIDVFGTGGHQSNHYNDNKNYDVFIAKFNNNGHRIWGTYYGGNAFEMPSDLKLDFKGNIYISGSTTSTNIIGEDGYQDFIGGSQDAFFAIFDTSGQRKYGSYYGGNSVDEANCIVLDSENCVHLAGFTYSTDVIGYGGFQTTGGTSMDAFIVKFKTTSLSIKASYLNDHEFCSGKTIRIPINKTGIFNKGNSFKIEISNSLGYFSSPTVIGSQSDSTLDFIDATFPFFKTTSWFYRLRVSSTDPYILGNQNGTDLTIYYIPETPIIGTNGYALYSSILIGNQWYDENGAISGATSKYYTPSKSGEYYVFVTVDGCTSDISNKLYYKLGAMEEKANSSLLNIYPNPFNNELIIELNQLYNNANVSIIDLQGTEVLHQQLYSLKTIIQTANIPKGFYFLKFQTKATIEMLKIVKE